MKWDDHRIHLVACSGDTVYRVWQSGQVAVLQIRSGAERVEKTFMTRDHACAFAERHAQTKEPA